MNGSRVKPALERGVPQMEVSRRSGMVMEAISGVDIAVWDVKAQALGVPVYQALGAVRSSVRGYGSGGWAAGDAAEAELGGYAKKGFSAVKMRVVGADGFSIENCVRRVKAARRGIGPKVELMIDAHGSLETPVAIRLAEALEPYDIAWFEEPVSPENHAGQAEVRSATSIPIASGEREFSRYGFRSLLEHKAIDIAQPDVARAGGLTEIRRIAALTGAHDIRLAPHAWGSGVLFAASIHVAMAAAELPHARSEHGLHADDVRALQRALRHPARRHGARPGEARARVHAAARRVGAFQVRGWAGVRVLIRRPGPLLVAGLIGIGLALPVLLDLGADIVADSPDAFGAL